MTDKPPTASPPSFMAKFQLIQALLEQAHIQGKTPFNDVLTFIAHARRVDDVQTSPQSLRAISMSLTRLTGVDVSPEAVRRWDRDAERILADRARDAERQLAVTADAS